MSSTLSHRPSIKKLLPDTNWFYGSTFALLVALLAATIVLLPSEKMRVLVWIGQKLAYRKKKSLENSLVDFHENSTLKKFFLGETLEID